MDYINNISHLLTFAAFGYCRLGPVFYLMPFMNSGTVPSVIRFPVIAFISLQIIPGSSIDFYNLNTITLILLVMKEIALGLFLAVILTFPFWVFHAIGSLIDNQRGATLSSTLDPSTGIDSSELAKFLNMFAAVIYLENDGMVHLMSVLRTSYMINDPLTFNFPGILPVINYITEMMSATIIVSSPVIGLLLGSEIFLGILSRYASQLNAFSVSLTIKSGVAFFALLLYFYPTFIDSIGNITPSLNIIKNYLHG